MSPYQGARAEEQCHGGCRWEVRQSEPGRNNRTEKPEIAQSPRVPLRWRSGVHPEGEGVCSRVANVAG